MNIALDLDDTISRCPPFFSILSKAFIASGHKVYVITHREDRAFAAEDLAAYGISYDELILPTVEEFQRNTSGEWRTSIGAWKAEMCRRLEVDVCIDDMPDVVNALDERILALMVVDRSLGDVRYSKE